MAETVVMTLADFLLARIAEDEADARAATPGPWKTFADAEGGVWAADGYGMAATGCAQQNGDHIARHDPARVLAECEAKRQIVELYAAWAERYAMTGDAADRSTHGALFAAVLRLALPYADHPDYVSAVGPAPLTTNETREDT